MIIKNNKIIVLSILILFLFLASNASATSVTRITGDYSSTLYSVKPSKNRLKECNIYEREWVRERCRNLIIERDTYNYYHIVAYGKIVCNSSGRIIITIVRREKWRNDTEYKVPVVCRQIKRTSNRGGNKNTVISYEGNFRKAFDVPEYGYFQGVRAQYKSIKVNL